MLINYAQTYHNAKICYHSSSMILNVKSYAAYLVITGSHSCISGNYYLSNHTIKPTNCSGVNPYGTILTKCKTLWRVVGFAAESNTGGLFVNFYNIVPIWTALVELDHLKHKTPLNIYNSASKGCSTHSIHKKWSKSWDMSFRWIRDRDAQEQLKKSGTKVSITIQIISLRTNHSPIINACARNLY